MPNVDEPMEMVVIPTSENAVFVLFFIILIALGGMMFWMNSQAGKKWRLESMQQACAEGQAEPQKCIKEGVPMTWAVKE